MAIDYRRGDGNLRTVRLPETGAPIWTLRKAKMLRGGVNEPQLVMLRSVLAMPDLVFGHTPQTTLYCMGKWTI